MNKLSYQDRLTKLNLCSLEFRRLRGDLIELFKMSKGLSGLEFNQFFKLATNNLRGHDMKIYKERFNLNIGKFNFKNRVIDYWNKLPASAVQSDSIQSFKNRIDIVLKEDWGLL